MQQLDEDFTERLRNELARRRMSRQALADMARISLSTLEKALSGSRPFTQATVVRIEEALGTDLRGRQNQDPELAAFRDSAPGHMGAYSRAAIHWIEQDYVTMRPSFSTPGAVITYRTRIAWDETAGHLLFAESARVDGAFAQSGYVSMPNLSGHIYLATNESGQHRLIILGRPARSGQMSGMLTTLEAGAGSQLVPVACPIVFVPQPQLASVAMGVIAPDNIAFAELRAILDRVVGEDFCRWRQ